VVIRDPHLVLELVDELTDRLHLDAGFAARRLGGLEHLEPRRDVDAVGLGRLLVDRLLLRLHDVGQARIARLVEAQIGGDDRRRLELDGLQAAVDLARDQMLSPSIVSLEAKVPCGQPVSAASIWPSLVAVVVDRLLAHDDEAGLLLLDDGLEDLGDGERLDLVGLHQDAAVGAHGEPGADSLGACCGPIDTHTTSVAWPFSLSRSASSTAISSKGFIDILTLASSTPLPSLLTRIFTL
jgi:hypothetical protein